MSNPNSGNKLVSIDSDTNIGIIIDFINQMPYPTAVLTFGVVCDFKTQATNAIFKNVPNATIIAPVQTNDNEYLHRCIQEKNQIPVIPVDPTWTSNLVDRLYEAGAKSIIGIYVKPIPDHLFGSENSLNMFWKLEQNPPRRVPGKMDLVFTLYEPATRILWSDISNLRCVQAANVALDVDGVSVTDALSINNDNRPLLSKKLKITLPMFPLYIAKIIFARLECSHFNDDCCPGLR